MNNSVKRILSVALLVIVAVFAFSFISCDNGSTPIVSGNTVTEIYNKHHGDSIHHLHRLCYHGIPAHTATFEESSYSTRQTYHTMSRLSPMQAAAITLRLKGYTHCQIARKMGTTTSLAKHHLIMARRILDKIWYN